MIKKKQKTQKNQKDGNFLKDWENCRNRHSGQKEVINEYLNGKRAIFNRAGRKFAKTTTNIDIAWHLANTQPKSVVYFCFPTITQGIEVVWEEERLQNCDLKTDVMRERYVEAVNNNKYMVQFKNGSFIKLIGTWSEARGRGTQPDLLIVDEIQDASADYLEAMYPNLASKDARIVMSGTPARKRNHYHEWEDRIKGNPRGATFKFTSYSNDKIPHLKEWLDNERNALIAAGKEDVWLREYMAEDCFTSIDRLLPDASFLNRQDIDSMVMAYDYSTRIPVTTTIIHERYFCSIMGILIPKKGLFIYELVKIPQLWCRRFHEMYEEVGKKIAPIQDMCGCKPRNLVYDPTLSFQEMITGFTRAREDIKWQKRGYSILKEMMLDKKIHFSEELLDLGLECQKIFIDDSQTSIEEQYPIICAVTTMVNEYFQPESIKVQKIGKYDPLDELRRSGIYCQPKKSNLLWKI